MCCVLVYLFRFSFTWGVSVLLFVGGFVLWCCLFSCLGLLIYFGCLLVLVEFCGGLNYVLFCCLRVWFICVLLICVWYFDCLLGILCLFCVYCALLGFLVDFVVSVVGCVVCVGLWLVGLSRGFCLCLIDLCLFRLLGWMIVYFDVCLPFV